MLKEDGKIHRYKIYGEEHRPSDPKRAQAAQIRAVFFAAIIAMLFPQCSHREERKESEKREKG
jgi:hypothetical protein